MGNFEYLGQSMGSTPQLLACVSHGIDGADRPVKMPMRRQLDLVTGITDSAPGLRQIGNWLVQRDQSKILMRRQLHLDWRHLFASWPASGMESIHEGPVEYADELPNFTL